MRGEGFVLSLVGGALLLFGSSASAQTPTFDHLTCYSMKDKRPFNAAFYSADLLHEQNPPFEDRPACTFKMKAKYFCVDVQKANVNPPTGGGPAATDARDYICYKIKPPKCPTASGLGASFKLDVTDQFASGTIWVKKPKLLCAPAVKNTSTSTTTTTTTTATTTTTLLEACSDVQGICQGPCPPTNPACSIPGADCALVDDGTGKLVCDCPCHEDPFTGCSGYCTQGTSESCTLTDVGCCCVVPCADQDPATCDQGYCPSPQTCVLDVPSQRCICQ